MSNTDSGLTVTVAYADEHIEFEREVQLRRGASARDAIVASGLLELAPRIDLGRNRVGIYSRLVTPEYKVRDGDRVEIYLPLIADAKAERRARARAAR